jgi:nicotinamide phosphoribosyltransferase
MSQSPTFAADFYKTGHYAQYPKRTSRVYSNFTARSAAHANMPESFDDKVVFFGLQGFIQEFLIHTWNREFFSKPKDHVIGKYKRRMDASLGEGSVDTKHLELLHDLGYLPLRIKALPEGSRVNLRVPLLTVENTLPEFYWLTNYIETAISAELWQPITSATLAFEYRRQLAKYVQLTGSDVGFADWQIHDFSLRGMAGIHAGAKSGAAHQLSSYGTDTIPAIDYLIDYYNANERNELIGGSVPATEHSVMCAGGMGDDEIDTFSRIITDIYPTGIVSIVSDTWDFWRVITQYAAYLKDEILDRKPNALGQAKVVFRPDSGDPVKILCGDPEASPGSPAFKGAVECLWDLFGGTETAKGYKTLHERVGLIYGDSITLERQGQILQQLMDKGFSAGNVVFGVGSYTYQHVTRDTFGMAMKATWCEVAGESRPLFKDPVTDGGTKRSAKGWLRVEKVGHDFVLLDEQTELEAQGGELRRVFEDGQMTVNDSLATIRGRLGAIGSAAFVPKFERKKVDDTEGGAP